MRPNILITRPEPKGAAFANALRSRWDGEIDVILSPLLQIVPLCTTLPDADAFIFTSTNGVDQAIRLGAEPGKTAYCVGEVTGDAASKVGFRVMTGTGDAASMIDMLIRNPPHGSLAHIRGQYARGDIATSLCKAGIACLDVVAYDQASVPLSGQAKTVLNGETPVMVPLFSPRTAALFSDEGPYHAPLYVISISDAAIPDIPMMANHVADRKTGDAMCDATIAGLNALAHL